MNDEKHTDERRRIALSLPDDLDEVLNRLSHHFGKPKSRIITDMLLDAMPTMKKMVVAADKLESMKSGVLNFIGKGKRDHATD